MHRLSDRGRVARVAFPIMSRNARSKGAEVFRFALRDRIGAAAAIVTDGHVAGKPQVGNLKNRHCEEPKATKQSIKRRRIKHVAGMDCFAALAMTAAMTAEVEVFGGSQVIRIERE
ncbi:MAG: hypothetical protein P4M13_06550 [Alphaproteobacteria bacterium]|nr:hypothetical protein [Alphaproteobacteria bacterium]